MISFDTVVGWAAIIAAATGVIIIFLTVLYGHGPWRSGGILGE
jgi:hypothetical protein